MPLKLILRDGVWYATGTVPTPTGKVRVRKSTGFGTSEKRYAEDVMRRILHDAATGKFGAKPDSGTLREAITLFLTRPQRPGETDQMILNKLADELGHRPLAEVKGADLMAWISGRSSKPGTVGRYLASVKAMLRYAKSLGLEVPVFDVKRPFADDARTRWLTKEERDHLIEHINPASRGLLTFLFHTGCRVGEALALNWGDVVLREGKGVVRLQSRKGKGSKLRTRMVPLTASAITALYVERAKLEKRLGRKRPIAATDPVFIGVTTPRMNYQTFRLHFTAACKLLEIEDFRVHDARHTFASLLLQSKVQEKAIADLLGHSTLAMMGRYAHLDDTHYAEAVQLLESDAVGDVRKVLEAQTGHSAGTDGV